MSSIPRRNRGIRILWRVRDGAGLVGRLGQRSIESIKDITQRIRPEHPKEEPEHPQEMPEAPPSFVSAIFESEESEIVDEARFKAHLVDKTKNEKERKRTRVM